LGATIAAFASTAYDFVIGRFFEGLIGHGDECPKDELWYDKGAKPMLRVSHLRLRPEGFASANDSDNLAVTPLLKVSRGILGHERCADPGPAGREPSLNRFSPQAESAPGPIARCGEERLGECRLAFRGLRHGHWPLDHMVAGGATGPEVHSDRTVPLESGDLPDLDLGRAAGHRELGRGGGIAGSTVAAAG